MERVADPADGDAAAHELYKGLGAVSRVDVVHILRSKDPSRPSEPKKRSQSAKRLTPGCDLGRDEGRYVGEAGGRVGELSVAHLVHQIALPEYTYTWRCVVGPPSRDASPHSL